MLESGYAVVRDDNKIMGIAGVPLSAASASLERYLKDKTGRGYVIRSVYLGNTTPSAPPAPSETV